MHIKLKLYICIRIYKIPIPNHWSFKCKTNSNRLIVTSYANINKLDMFAGLKHTIGSSQFAQRPVSSSCDRNLY